MAAGVLGVPRDLGECLYSMLSFIYLGKREVLCRLAQKEAFEQSKEGPCISG